MLDVLEEAAAAIGAALGRLDDWGLAGTREGQYRSDLAADEAALSVLGDAGFGVLSEESGLSWPDREVVVVVDPVDGSTNAARGIPWFATSLCAVDSSGMAAGLVVNLASGVRFSAVRGEGAFRDGVRVRPSGCTSLGDAVIGLSGYPSVPFGWRQFRALGAAALDLCAVACGWLDAYVDCSPDAHGVWDYLGALLVCQEAGAAVGEAFDRDLVVRDPAARRTPLAAGSPALLAAVTEARRNLR